MEEIMWGFINFFPVLKSRITGVLAVDRWTLPFN